MAETDLADWLTIAEAAQAIGCSTRTVERLGRARKLEQRLRPQAGSPAVAVYNPDDVARIASERQPAHVPFVLGAGQHGNGSSRGVSGLSEVSIDTDALARLPTSEDPIRQLFAAALRAVLSPPSPPVSAMVSETALFLTVKDAAAYANLPAIDIRRACESGELKARKTGRGGWRIRRKELEQL